MTDEAREARRRSLTGLGWAVVVSVLVSAAISFIVSNSEYFWSGQDYGRITQISGFVGVPAFIAWMCGSVWLLLKFRHSFRWVLLSAPLALWTPLRLLIFVVGMMFYRP